MPLLWATQHSCTCESVHCVHPQAYELCMRAMHDLVGKLRVEKLAVASRVHQAMYVLREDFDQIMILADRAKPCFIM